MSRLPKRIVVVDHDRGYVIYFDGDLATFREGGDTYTVMRDILRLIGVEYVAAEVPEASDLPGFEGGQGYTPPGKLETLLAHVGKGKVGDMVKHLATLRDVADDANERLADAERLVALFQEVLAD